MKKSLIALFLLVSAVSDAAVFSLPQMALNVKDTLFHQLQSIGVLRLDPYDPRLPYPQVSAIEALYNPKNSALAYYDQETEFGGITYVIKNRQGGNRHRISYNEEHAEFVTPYAGQVAHVNRFKTVAGWQYDFYCHSAHVDAVTFDHCVRADFINVVVQQMLRSF